jgi:hypothetical protein
MDKTTKTPSKTPRYVPSKSLVASSTRQQQPQQQQQQRPHHPGASLPHQHPLMMNSLYNLPTEDEPRPMCGQALISKILKKSDGKRGSHIRLDHHQQNGLFSMELAADTVSDGGSSSAAIPKFIMNITANELKQINKDKARANSSKKKNKGKQYQPQEDSPSSRTSLTTEDLAQLSPYSPPNSTTDSTNDHNSSSNNNTNTSSGKTNDQGNSPSRLRVRVLEVKSEDDEVLCSLGDNISSHDGSSTTSTTHGDDNDSLVSSMKAVLEEQQKALQEMAAQNHQFKDALMSYNAELQLLRQERLEQKIRMAQLVLQNETFETQSVVLRSEISSLRSMLDEKQEDDLRHRFESLLDDEDSVYDAELEEKVLRGRSSYDSFEDEIVKSTPARNTPGDSLDAVTDPMTNFTVTSKSVLDQVDQTEEERDYTVQFSQSVEHPFDDRHRSRADGSAVAGGDAGVVDQLQKARRALSRKVAAPEVSPRAVLAPRAASNHNHQQQQQQHVNGANSPPQRRPSPGGAQESIEVSLLDDIDDDHDDGVTLFTAMSSMSGTSKSSANAYRDRLGEIKKKRKERFSLPALFEGEIGKTYEA